MWEEGEAGEGEQEDIDPEVLYPGRVAKDAGAAAGYLAKHVEEDEGYIAGENAKKDKGGIETESLGSGEQEAAGGEEFGDRNYAGKRIGERVRDRLVIHAFREVAEVGELVGRGVGKKQYQQSRDDSGQYFSFHDRIKV